MEGGKDRPLLAEDMSDLLLEGGEVEEFVALRIACRAREAPEIELRVRERMSAVRLVGAILAEEMDQVPGRGGADRHQRSEIHQQAAVAVEDDDAPVRPAERETEPARGSEPHRAERIVIERARRELEPVEGRGIDRDDD